MPLVPESPSVSNAVNWVPPKPPLADRIVYVPDLYAPLAKVTSALLPVRVAVLLTFVRENVAAAAPCTRYNEPAFKTSVPFTLNVPGAPMLPGNSVPPLWIVALPTEPVPISVPPELTVVAETIEPVTLSGPMTVVGPV